MSPLLTWASPVWVALGLLLGFLCKKTKIVEKRIQPITIVSDGSFKVPLKTDRLEVNLVGGGGGAGGRASGTGYGSNSSGPQPSNSGYGRYWSGAWTDDDGRRWWSCSRHNGNFRQDEPCPGCEAEEAKDAKVDSR